MRVLRLTSLALLLFLCGCLHIPNQTKKVYSGQKNFCSNFNEANVYEILRGMGITNQCVYQITRDSTGAALIVVLEEISNEPKLSALVIRDNSCSITNLFQYGRFVGFYDDMTIAYAQQGDHFVFRDGFELPVMHTTNNSYLWIIGCPGNAVLAYKYYDESDYSIVFSRDPRQVLFRVGQTSGISVERIFFKEGMILIFGTASHLKENGKGFYTKEGWIYKEVDGRWEIQKRMVIPNAWEVLDVDPESQRVLCSKGGFGHRKGFLFDLETGQVSNAHLAIWRDHGCFLESAVVDEILRRDLKY